MRAGNLRARRSPMSHPKEAETNDVSPRSSLDQSPHNKLEKLLRRHILTSLVRSCLFTSLIIYCITYLQQPTQVDQHEQALASMILPRRQAFRQSPRPYYGNLSTQRRKGTTFAREIPIDEPQRYELYKKTLVDRMDKPDVSTSGAFLKSLPDEERQWMKRVAKAKAISRQDGDPNCYPTDLKHRLDPVCNKFHEIRLFDPQEEYQVKFLGEGYFRYAWLLSRPDDTAVLKKYNPLYQVDEFVLSQTQREAVILEQLSHSPRIMDICGHCGMAVLVEDAPEQVQDEIKPHNEG